MKFESLSVLHRLGYSKLFPIMEKKSIHPPPLSLCLSLCVFGHHSASSDWYSLHFSAGWYTDQFTTSVGGSLSIWGWSAFMILQSNFPNSLPEMPFNDMCRILDLIFAFDSSRMFQTSICSHVVYAERCKSERNKMYLHFMLYSNVPRLQQVSKRLVTYMVQKCNPERATCSRNIQTMCAFKNDPLNIVFSISFSFVCDQTWTQTCRSMCTAVPNRCNEGRA